MDPLGRYLLEHLFNCLSNLYFLFQHVWGVEISDLGVKKTESSHFY